MILLFQIEWSRHRISRNFTQEYPSSSEADNFNRRFWVTRERIAYPLRILNL